MSRDTRRTGRGIVVLAVLGFLGLFQTGAAAFNAAARAKDPTWLLAFLGGIVFLLLCSTGFVYLRARGGSTAMGVGRILLGALTMAGGLFVAATALGVVMLVYLFIQCSQGFR